ncbi:delta-like protein 4 isoform X2 [Gigantopelta aegis]|uniref:delta-like protein 4 isoform X2 n=1 Tax=Gigantopelta aegis TaxID=1735272 RepID=UPI001B889DB7|nr:delta-like protein 4 isoform X2 [Gigantopelta aegis]
MDIMVDGRSSCFPNQCLNGGYCLESGDSFICQCLQGFTGALCETETSTLYPDCPRYPCPSDVSEYSYPDWNDNTCTQYYLCRRGNLSKVSCRGSNRFNVATLECMDPNSDTYVDCRANIFSK